MKRALLLVALAVVLLASAAARADGPDARGARLESVCRLWGVVKFFHPWTAGSEIDWDGALVEALPRVDSAESPEEFREAVGALLESLNDPLTRVLEPSAPAPAGEAPAPEGASVATVKRAGRKLAVIDATRWRALVLQGSSRRGPLFATAIAGAADADGIVLDLRRSGPAAGPEEAELEAWMIGTALSEDIAVLLRSPLRLAADRTRFHSGYAPQSGGTSGGYTSGFQTTQHTVVRARPGPAAGRPLAVLTNAGSRGVADLLMALQSEGVATLVHEGETAALASGTFYDMTLADGVTARVRTSDKIGADGSVGFAPAVVLPAPAERSRDEAMERALAIASGEAPPARGASDPAGAAPIERKENPYAEMTYPSREYRLLALFRLWNVMHYFFPYHRHMDRGWDAALTEFLPRFEKAGDAQEYQRAVMEMATWLQDSHVYVGGPSVRGLMGTHYLPLGVANVRGELLVTEVFEGEGASQFKVGDVIVAIDGVPAQERIAGLAKYKAASTPQGLAFFASRALLSGAEGEEVALTVRGADGPAREVRLARTMEGRAHFQAVLAARSVNPVFGVRPDGFGYMDLIRLEQAQVAEAFEAVKETPALILDMRGYPRGTAWEICARLTDAPMIMAVFHRPYWTSPDPDERTEFSFNQPIRPSPLWKYTGKVVVLINERAISQSEHSCLGFEGAAKGRITFIGTPTVGANGDVTNTVLPGGISVGFSGHDVRHADGRPLQRVGIQPDIRVEPTAAGLAEGRDEVMEAAVEFLKRS